MPDISYTADLGALIAWAGAWGCTIWAAYQKGAADAAREAEDAVTNAVRVVRQATGED